MLTTSFYMDNRITWLIPVLNGMPYLPETLASIESQTYKNWEVLVWDNGSTDGTLEELEKWIPNRLPGRVITGEPHGIGGSLARMVQECNTELCARMDADDINLPDRLEKQLEFLSTHPEIAVLGSRVYLVNEEGNSLEDLYPLPINHEEIVYEMLFRNPISHPSVIFRRSIVLQVGNYREFPNIEDYDLWLRIAASHKLENLAKPLLKYRIHNKSETRIATQENRIRKAISDCVCQNAPLIFGCTENDMRLLVDRNHPCAIYPILRIAKHLKKNQIDKSTNMLNSASFSRSIGYLIADKDIISRIFIAAFSPDKSLLCREFKSMSKAIIRKISRASKFLTVSN